MEDQQPQTPQVQTPQSAQNNPQPAGDNNVDLASLFKDGEPGTYDTDKITQLIKNYENSKKSASYFQSQYMKKQGIPETVDGYFGANWHADSAYENAMNNEDVKQAKDKLANFAFQNNISPRDAELFFDYTMKNLAKTGYFEQKTPEQIAEEQKKADEEAMKEVAPMLESINRTKEDNDKYISAFFESQGNPFTNDPNMKNYLEQIADDGAMGYKLITMMEQMFSHRGVPPISGTVAGKDTAAFEKQLAQESNPEARDRMMREFYGE